MGAESNFTTAIKPIEKAAGVVVGGARGGHAAKREVVPALPPSLKLRRPGIEKPVEALAQTGARTHDHRSSWLWEL